MELPRRLISFGLGFQFGGYLGVLVIVMPLMFAVGYGLEKLLVAPLRKRPDWENKVMMLTLGLALFLTSLYQVVFGVRMKSLPPIFEVGQLVFSYQDIMIFVMSLGGILLFGWLLNNTRLGMAVRAVAQNPIGAKIVGIPQERIFAATFAISTVMVGFGGILLSQKYFINPNSGGTIMVKAWVVTALEALVGWIFGMSYSIIALFILLLATLAFRPQGLMGKGE